MLHNKKGFTLIELIVVIVIIGILAAIAAPIMSANTKKARQTEAFAALGAIRTAERLYISETSGTVYAAMGAAGLENYLKRTDLNGRYYNGTDYVVTGNIANGVNSNTSIGTVNMNLDTGATTTS